MVRKCINHQKKLSEIRKDYHTEELCDPSFNEIYKLLPDVNKNIISEEQTNYAINICDSIVNESCKNKCLFTIVELGISNDVKFCEFGINKEQREKCYLNLAVRTHDISICDKMTISLWLKEEDTFNWCYDMHNKSIEDKGNLIENYTLCTQSTPVSYCKSKVANNFEECNNFLEKNDEKDVCYMKFIGITDISNPNYQTYKSFNCNKFNTIIGKQFCEDSKKEGFWSTCCSSD